jgi:uroporphyrin-III C-methyltransferase
MSTEVTPPAAPIIGTVYLIGAGPGAADLITVRGARLLERADVVLYDALVTEDMLAYCANATLIYVGKRSGQRSTAQHSINQQLVDCASKYKTVIRLKGGDPMLFGRADEELRALESNNSPYEIVPGITAALAAAAATKQPLTKRGVARSVSLFTSCVAPGESEEVIMPNGDTLVQYMGGQQAIATARHLIARGHPATTPVIVVESCSKPDERIVYLQLDSLEQGLSESSGPVLVMIGAALAQRQH